MIHGSFPRTAQVSVLSALVAGLLAGCSDYSSLRYESYPKDLRYPLRGDLLVSPRDQIPPPPENRFSPPGKLEEGIKKAAEQPGARTFDPKNLTPADRKDLTTALETVFGTPHAPRVGPEEDSDEDAVYKQWQQQQMATLGLENASAIDNLELDPAILARGSKLYRRHCLHCHGLAGDGRGPTGPWVHPHPRDYRSGQFKFLSTGDVGRRKPRRDDLLRIVRNGIDGTSMPSFTLLPEHEQQYLVSYVMHLSIRGQVEFETMRELITAGSQDTLDRFEGKPGETETSAIQHHVYSQTAQILIAWARSNDSKPYEPPPYTEPTKKEELQKSIRAGHQLFLGKAGCITCHTDYGRQVTYRYDVWGTIVRPQNLTSNVYRGGRRPIDLFWRIKGGIEPSGMIAQTALSDKEFWELVDFVRALPYPSMLPEDVRQAVYGASDAKKDDKHASAAK